MDLKHEMMFREDVSSLVKTEPRLHSPTTNNGLQSTTVLTNNINVGNNGLQLNGLVTSIPSGSSNGLQNNSTIPTNGSFGTIVNSTGTKRPRPDDFFSSPSPGTVSVSAPPLTPSPGPPSHTYTVISNGYSSPMSSGSYDPYSPNGKIGKWIFSSSYIIISSYKTCILRIRDINFHFFGSANGQSFVFRPPRNNRIELYLSF